MTTKETTVTAGLRWFRVERCQRYGGAEGIGVLRCSRDDGKDRQRQRQEADNEGIGKRQKQLPFGDDNQRDNDNQKDNGNQRDNR
jgi:hypothetical protein